MKTRIRKITTNNGIIKYHIQKKWNFENPILYFIPILGQLMLLTELFEWNDVWHRFSDHKNYYFSEEAAKRSIDLYLDIKEKEKQSEKDDKIKSIEYIKYP